MSTPARRPLLGLFVAAGLVAAGCSGGSDASTATTDLVAESPAPATTAAPVTTAAPTTQPPATTAVATTAPSVTEAPPVTVAEPDAWTSVDPGPDCTCSDGSPYELWDRPGDPTKVVLFLEGGGACWSAETCGPGGPYTPSLDIGVPPSGRSGVFDQTNPENPVADYSMVYVPYCTGDTHLGNSTTDYAPGLTIEHNGFVNASAGLDHLVATYPDVQQLVVIGSSAGSVATPVFAALAADELPDAEVIAFGDSSGAYPDDPAFDPLFEAWNLASVAPDWLVPAGTSVTDAGGSPGLTVAASLHDPDITFARFDYASDAVQTFFDGLVGVPPAALVTYLDETAAQIGAAGVPLASYLAPGDAHTVTAEDEFYTVEVGGVRLIDWFTALVTGETPESVR